MSISAFDLFTIGIGPSSSHTIGPMRAAKWFIDGLVEQGVLTRVDRIKVELYGSLGATGKGHGSDKAVLLGLQGDLPESVDVDTVEQQLETIRSSKLISLNRDHVISIDEPQDLIMHRRETLEHHSNGMKFAAFNADGQELVNKIYYSVGGGFVLDEAAMGADRIVEDSTELPYPFSTAEELLAITHEYQMSISDVMLENEKMWRSEVEIREGMLEIGE